MDQWDTTFLKYLFLTCISVENSIKLINFLNEIRWLLDLYLIIILTCPILFTNSAIRYYINYFLMIFFTLKLRLDSNTYRNLSRYVIISPLRSTIISIIIIIMWVSSLCVGSLPLLHQRGFTPLCFLGFLYYIVENWVWSFNKVCHMVMLVYLSIWYYR
jgi:FlaA1/EpsC-like NDP-sugar epimerase